jgi:hypothetical protein
VAVFQTFRTDGGLQFDAGLMTMALIGKGTVTTQTRLSGNTTASSALVPLPDLSSPIIIAVQSSFAAARAGRYVSNGQPVAHFATNGAVGQPLNYWLFGQSNRFPPTGVGLELYDTAGNLTYSSSRPVCTIADVLPGVLQSRTLSASRQYAMAAQEFTGHSSNNGEVYMNGRPWEPGDGGNTSSSSWSYINDGKLYGCAVRGAEVATGFVSYDDVRRTLGTSRTPLYPPPSAKWSRPMGAVLVIDVTGL